MIISVLYQKAQGLLILCLHYIWDGYVIGQTQDVFGDKIYSDLGERIDAIIEEATGGDEVKDDAEIDRLTKKFKETVVTPVVDTVKQRYGTDVKKSDEKQLQRQLGSEAERRVKQAVGSFNIERRTLEQEHTDALANMVHEGRSEYFALHLVSLK